MSARPRQVSNSEIRKGCGLCGSRVLGNGFEAGARVVVHRRLIDAAAVRRHMGLSLVLGGGPGGEALADVMGTQGCVVEMDPVELSLCTTCCHQHALPLIEVAADRQAEDGR